MHLLYLSITHCDMCVRKADDTSLRYPGSTLSITCHISRACPSLGDTRESNREVTAQLNHTLHCMGSRIMHVCFNDLQLVTRMALGSDTATPFTIQKRPPGSQSQGPATARSAAAAATATAIAAATAAASHVVPRAGWWDARDLLHVLLLLHHQRGVSVSDETIHDDLNGAHKYQ